jgi:hypothetical protein
LLKYFPYGLGLVSGCWTLAAGSWSLIISSNHTLMLDAGLEAISKGPPLKIQSMGHPAMLGKSFGPNSALGAHIKSSKYRCIPPV